MQTEEKKELLWKGIATMRKRELALALIRQIRLLPEGKSCYIRYIGKGSIKTYCNLIYTYLHSNKIKQFYRVYVEDDFIIRIKRLAARKETFYAI